MRKYLKILLLIFVFLALAGTRYESKAQPPSKCNPNDPDYNPDDECIPIDGGLTILLLVGAGYGIKKYRSSRRQEIVTTESSDNKKYGLG